MIFAPSASSVEAAVKSATHRPEGSGPDPAARRGAASWEGPLRSGMRHRFGSVVTAWLVLSACLVPGAAAWGAVREADPPRTVYIFHLRNGSQIQATHYWEQGPEYRIERFGGVMGFRKADVVRIERLQEGSEREPVPATAEGPARLQGDPDASPGVTAYVLELIEWVRSWVARLWAPRRAPEQGLQAGASRPPVKAATDRRPPEAKGTPRESGPTGVVVLVVVLLAVPLLVFGGKVLGQRLFGGRSP